MLDTIGDGFYRAEGFGLTLHVCPTDIVRAPAHRVWTLVTTPDELAGWSDTRIVDAPGRPLDVGDRLVLGAGPGHRMRVVFDVREAAAPRHLALRIHLPFAVVNDEIIEIVPLNEHSSRVTFT
jgi:uncharacterized protein YndB with AHSA1/START domain